MCRLLKVKNVDAVVIRSLKLDVAQMLDVLPNMSDEVELVMAPGSWIETITPIQDRRALVVNLAAYAE